jgi:nicotinamidase-related amidase
VLAKTTSGAVASTPLAETLRGLGVETVVVAGVATDVSVTQTARELADHGFQAVIVADASTALAESRHQAALETFTFAYGSVSTTRAILAALPRPAAGAA